MEANQTWARVAPVLMVTVARNTFSRNDKPNRVAIHDVGLAVANLTFEATARGLVVHQMGGIDVEKVRTTYDLPEEFEAVTAVTIGYRAEPGATPEALSPSPTLQLRRIPVSFA